MAAPSAPMIEKARDFISAFNTSEARFFQEERFSEAELRKSLADSQTDRKLEAMKRILAGVSVGRDCSALFADVVKNIAAPSLELKKMIYIYLVQYGEHNRELALLSINSFQKDLTDRSQLVRASALRAMASIKVLEVIQIVMVAVRTAASDTSPYVRKTAAQCTIKVYGIDPDQFLDLRTLLLKLMSDSEITVVGSALLAFHHLVVERPPTSATSQGAQQQQEGGAAAAEDSALRAQLALLHPNFRRLCQELPSMDSWSQQCCIDLLTRYCRLFFASESTRRELAAEGTDSASGTEPPLPEDLALFLKSLKIVLFSASKGATVAAAVALCYLAPQQEMKVVTMPLLRCLRQSPPESTRAILIALRPLIESHPELFRPSIREFFVYSFDFLEIKEVKLQILELLADESNVQTVLRELQAYVSWQSEPSFVASAVRSISHIALKLKSVADSCLGGLVKMLDSRCEALSCEAVVALRALLQRRRETHDSGLGAVLPQLGRHLEDLQAPAARASVIWIIGQYQREAPRLAPDVLRKLAKTFVNEKQEVKQQIMGLSFKVCSFHSLNARGEIPSTLGGDGKDDAVAAGCSPEDSAKLFPRLEKIAEHIAELAAFDSSWDVRDAARALRKLRESAKGTPGPDLTEGMTALGAWYSKACLGLGENPNTTESSPKPADALVEQGAGHLQSSFILGSLAQALDFPLDSYRPLPDWAEADSSSELRMPPKVTAPPKSDAPKSISSASVSQVHHIENRVQAPSNITNVPVASSLEDLDLFYSTPAAPSRPPAAATPGPTRAAAAAQKQEPRQTLEQFSLVPPSAPASAPASAAPNIVVGTAIFGEDEESDEEDDSDAPPADDDDDWKYCAQAAPPASAAPAAAPPQPAPAAAAPPQQAAAAAAAAAAAVAEATVIAAKTTAAKAIRVEEAASPGVASTTPQLEKMTSEMAAAADEGAGTTAATSFATAADITKASASGPMAEMEVDLWSLAALSVAEAAGQAKTLNALKSLILPDELCAPAAWVDDGGEFNEAVVRYVLISLIAAVQNNPGSTIPSLARRLKLLEEVEVAVLMDRLVRVEAVAKRTGHAGQCCYYSGALLVGIPGLNF